MKFTMAHTNINVTDMDRSLAFYNKALGLEVIKRREAEDGSFVLAFISDGTSSCVLELTWLKDKEGPYELGDNETHLAFIVDDYDAARKQHGEMDCICYDNTSMGLYFIEDPDGYWIEILPANR